MITAPLYSSRWETYGLHHSNLACYQCAAKTFLVPEHLWCGGTCTERDRAHLSFHLSRKFLKKGCSVAIPVTLSMPVGCIYTCVFDDCRSHRRLAACTTPFHANALASTQASVGDKTEAMI